jgi:very-short-patch-repair endonuclease
LRDRRLGGWKFKRQVPIDRFVVDFFCADAKLIVEIDGGQHDQAKERDGERRQILDAMGYFIMRFWNNDVLSNTDGVLETILSTLNQLSEPPHPSPLPSGEREQAEIVARSSNDL